MIALRSIGLAIVLALASALPAQAQQPPGGHEHHAPAPATPAPATSKPAPVAPAPAQQPHSGHEHHAPVPAQQPPAAPATAPLPSFIPPITDADRAAAFPDVRGHMVHGGGIRTYLLVDELEWRGGGGASGGHWDIDGWIGGDRDRLWLRAEAVGESGRPGGTFQELNAHVLWGRPLARWWTGVAGLRVDGQPGDAQAWAAFGVQGLAPYRIQTEVTGSFGGGGRTQLRVDLAHDLRLTRRFVAQTRVEAMLAGKSDDLRGLGKGLTGTDVGIRVRYEIRRDLAPYVGVTWHRAYGGTAAYERAHGESVSAARLVVGLRVWR